MCSNFEDSASAQKAQTKKLSHVLEEVLPKIEALCVHGQGFGIPTGFDSLDFFLDGLQRGDLICLAARPGMGKKTFALNLACNAAFSGKKCLFFSAALCAQQLVTRLLAAQSGICMQRLRRGELTRDDFAKLAEAAETLQKAELYVDDTPVPTVPEIRSHLCCLPGVDMLVIDDLASLCLPPCPGCTVACEQKAAQLCHSLKMLAKEFNIPAVVCTGLSSCVDAHGRARRPQLTDLQKIGPIEQCLDVVLFLYRAPYYADEEALESETADSQNEKIDDPRTELIIAKNRWGETGTVCLDYDFEHMCFHSVKIEQKK